MRSYAPGPDLLAGRVILVTGAGEGIGRAASRAFAAHGATAVLLGRSVPALEAVYDAIADAGHPEPAIYPMDLEGASPPHYEELAERVGGEFGRLDGLLHNAAILGTLTALERYDVELWARVMQVNLHAPFLLTRSCLALLRRSRDASLLFTSAHVGRRGRAYWGAYGVSQFAVEGMMQTLADELEASPHIRVNSIDPGPVNTRMRAEAYPVEDKRALATPESIMPAYLFLMGPDSRGVSGRALSAQAALGQDGGHA
ncbi:MAG: YciK family oxidoreductase [Gammaproteobacteria bacterium]|nr:YciK family oxidoreductase [Gammaproteobacteria bacterium]NIR82484.1 YciK family oxidoreductase [Gammaproteobacteria bacterium]NIR88480.1 YciK family oxidoreductase [Gammaproteobacteria bacterium]NIU03620.1 YciK family oxidoreductase [Gammaproteobacteria bacterium]NIV50972.1 YciK family oxidoreductase [Gammaproteobacteria bacterium]